ncbi:polyprotein [Gossypium australe]|uniref:Polyprotein n=1 Tax=Gossypium australe TaxID=47621 RepID=A0A5B6WSL4_9ROSI|nr:polyprotein [Gossypium australe]
MLGYDFEVVYRKGSHTVVAYALSRREALPIGQCLQLTTSTIISNLLPKVQVSWKTHDKLTKLWSKLQQQPQSYPKYTWDGKVLRRKGKMVKECLTCQKCKSDNTTSLGFMQPLDIPTRAWESINMDFIEGLPFSKGKNIILVMVDRLIKYGYFLTLTDPFSALLVVQEYFNNIYKLHGLLDSIVSDCDKELFKKLGTKLRMSSSYLPQRDG